MASRFTQYGGAKGAEDALKQMVMERIAAELEQRKQAVENYKLGQTDRGLDLEGGRLSEDARQFDAGHALNRDKLTEDVRQFDAQAPNREANAGYLRTQSEHLQGTGGRMAQEHTNRLTEIKAQGDQQARVAGIRTTTASEPLVLVTGADGRPVYTRRSEAEGMTPPPPSTGAANRQKAIDEVKILKQQLQDILAYGEQTGWKGVGGMWQGSASRVAKQNLGIGSDEGEMLRNKIGTLRTDIGHEKFGSAFTGSEKAMLNTFAPDIDRDPSAIKTNINNLLQEANRKEAQLTGAPQAQPAQGGGVTIKSIRQVR